MALLAALAPAEAGAKKKAPASTPPPAEVTEEKEPARLLVMDLEGASGITADDARTLTDLVVDEVSRFKAFRVMSQEDLRTMVELEGDRQAMGCSETSCLAELAGAIGARYVVYGRVSMLGSKTILQLNLLDSIAAKPVGRRGVKAQDLGELADRLPGAVDKLVKPALKELDPAGYEQVVASSSTRAPVEARPAEPAPGPAKAPDPAPEPPPPAPPRTPEEIAADCELKAGELPVLEKVTSTEEGVGVKGIAGTRAVFIVDASPDVVMKQIWQIERLHELLPGGEKSEKKRAGKDARGREWVEVTLSEKAVFVKLAYTARLLKDEKKRLITFQELDGDIKHVRGSILLEDPGAPGYTRVTYTVYVSVGMMVPSSWARGILSDQPEEMAEVLRERAQIATGKKKAPPPPSKGDRADKAAGKGPSKGSEKDKKGSEPEKRSKKRRTKKPKKAD